MLRRVVYVSRATDVLNDFQLRLLASRAAHRNATVGITGVLVYGGGWFIQAIEGPDTSVELLLNRIFRDCRHCDIEVLVDGEVRERMFRSWTMGVLNLDLVAEDVRTSLLEIMHRARRAGGTRAHSRSATMMLLRQFQLLAGGTQSKAG